MRQIFALSIRPVPFRAENCTLGFVAQFKAHPYIVEHIFQFILQIKKIQHWNKSGPKTVVGSGPWNEWLDIRMYEIVAGLHIQLLISDFQFNKVMFDLLLQKHFPVLTLQLTPIFYMWMNKELKIMYIHSKSVVTCEEHRNADVGGIHLFRYEIYERGTSNLIEYKKGVEISVDWFHA